VEAGLAGLRFHDLRHPITKLAEAGVPDHTLMAIAGHVNREMLEHYSHIRMQAKRGAVAALGRGKEEMSANSEVPVVEVSEMAVFHPVCWLPRSSWCKIDLILMRLRLAYASAHTKLSRPSARAAREMCASLEKSTCYIPNRNDESIECFPGTDDDSGLSPISSHVWLEWRDVDGEGQFRCGRSGAELFL